MFRKQCVAPFRERNSILSFFHLMRNQAGFTLIELISTLVIISVLAAILIPRYIDAETTAKMRGLDVGVAELNGRETLTWAMVKLSNTGYKRDQQVWDQLSVDPGIYLGADYEWPDLPNINPGTGKGTATLMFKKEKAPLNRTGSTIETPGRWQR
jgi:prepilin-type N-terminal cleavage/methylation domain-containing protein